ncbi:hypothetical protein GCM10023188_24950 [Pontibacter saemangeumensis]|uniref:Replication-associated protein G2P N-terminal domain-containing protein n=1 Tax=Pontibacter saemangeumensis TaxID=1084525 RepID=A0ABP8LTI2_9BACT
MIDTTKLYLSQEQAGSSVWDCLPFLTNLSETYRQDTGQTYVAGHIGNLRIGVFEHGISIAGSLPKFYLGTNLYTLNRSDSRRAFEMMADTLHLPVQKATVSRVDIGMNLLTNCKPELYYPYLGQSSYYNRLTQPKSISYQNNLRSKKFYNKIAESKSTGTAIPAIYQGKHVLRYEVCYTQRLCKQFNRALITPGTLIDEAFYMSLIDRFVKEYESIKKIGIPKMDKMKMRTPKGFWEQVSTLAIPLLGQENLLSLLEEMKAENGFSTDRNYYRIKDELIKRAGQTSTEQPELIQELNKKVARAKQSYR